MANSVPQSPFFAAAEETVALAVVIPYDSIEAKTAEAQQTLVALQSFQITCQEQMDYASGYLQRVKSLWSELDEQRKQAGRPLNKKLQEIRNSFRRPWTSCRRSRPGSSSASRRAIALLNRRRQEPSSRQRRRWSRATYRERRWRRRRPLHRTSTCLRVSRCGS